MGFVLILLFILGFIIKLWLLRSRIYLPVVLLAHRFFKEIKFMLVSRVVHQTSQIYGDISFQSLAQSLFHSLELHLPDTLFASPTKSATDRRSIFFAASAEAYDSHPMTTSSTNTTTQLLPATSTTLNMAALNSFYFQMPRHLSCSEGEKQDWSMATNLLPEDVLVEILSRLPVKSLLRFRSVAKSWRDMVKDPFFITKHHLTQVALNIGNCVLTRAGVVSKKRMEFALLTEDEQEINFTLLELPFSLESPFWDGSERYRPVYHVAGPCNGIVVISNADDQLFLWNPATREYKAFPPASLSHSWSDKLYRGGSNVGFGIDPITKDYKVVRIWHFRSGEVGEDFSINKAEVFSLSANNSSGMWPKGGGESWKIIDDVSPVCLNGSSNANGGAYLNGKYYWSIETIFERKCRIVWFDMGAEVFGLVELPDVYLDTPYISRLTITMFKGESCLAMLRHAYKIEEDKHMYEMWIIVDDDEGFSWTNYATFGPFLKLEVPLGVIGNNEELVVFNKCCGELEGDSVLESYVYNINTRVKTKNLMQGLYFDLCLPLAVYNETLVSVL